jgi:hypothetical protein
VYVISRQTSSTLNWLKFFGMGQYATHEQTCPICGAIVIKETNGSLSFRDFLEIKDKQRDFQSEVRKCSRDEVNIWCYLFASLTLSLITMKDNDAALFFRTAVS